MKSCKELVLLLVYINIYIYTEKYIIIVSYYTALYMIKRERVWKRKCNYALCVKKWKCILVFVCNC